MSSPKIEPAAPSQAVETDAPGLRVLLIAGCFPHPANRLFGVWALSQAEALADQGLRVEVVSPTSYVPSVLGGLGLAKWASLCPPKADIGSFEVSFPRWPVYHAKFARELTKRWPAPFLALGWRFVRRHLLDAVASHRPDVIFAHHSFEGGELARRLSQETGIPYVVADWDFDEITDCVRFPWRRKHYARVLAGCSGVIATSERMKTDIVGLFPRTRVTVGHYGRPPLPEAMVEKKRSADRNGKVIILSASGFYERKGLPLLIESFATLSDRCPNAELWIAGDGPERAAVKRAAEKAGGRVRLLGVLPHDGLLQEMVWADVFALAGWDEPFATVYVEALAAGTPVICGNDGGICDVLQDGVHGLAVPPRDGQALAAAMERLVKDEDLRAAMSLAAKALFDEKLTMAAYGRIIAQELTAAAEKRRGGRGGP